ncbi:MAG TPA: hypothetical protein PKJ38_15390 [Planctomycetota bacterium]|nr:hypothetical protein [Planctomycetota bacterium]
MTALASFLAALCAFNPPSDTSGPLTATLSAGPIGRTGEVVLAVENAAGEEGAGVVTFRAAPPWRVLPRREFQSSVPARGRVQIAVRIEAAGTVFPEFYALYAKVQLRVGGRLASAAPVLVFVPNVPWPEPPAPPPRAPLAAEVPDAGGSLAGLGIAVVSLETFRNGAVRRMPPGWSGTDEATGAVFGDGVAISRDGRASTALSFHVPWRGGAGRMTVDFPLVLPRVPLRARFGIGLRAHAPNEPPSDGITFKVAVLAPEPRELFARHTRQWEDASVDLSAYAGRAVTLRLTGDPGPAGDTTCDLGYFEDPRLEPAGAAGAAAAFTGEETFAVRSAEDWTVTVRKGRRGVWDSRFEMQNAGGAAFGFTGFEGRALLPDGRAIAAAWFVRDAVWRRDGEKLIAGHALAPTGFIECVVAPIEDGFTVGFRAEGCELLDVGPGPFDAEAERVYAGAGNVIVRPEPFRLNADGHRLAARFAGFDFPGISVVQATDTLPERLEVVPARRIYRLAAGEDPVFAFVAGTKGAFDAALRYRDSVASVQPAAPAVAALKGRFVFDIWGGRYGQGAAFLKRAAAYGLTHSLVVWHNWQRWGYDYRLPEIFPPNPAHGSLDEFQELAETCRKHGILFAPHDNYIDIYPDFDRFTYDLVCRDEAGRPLRAWYNRGRDAQSYRFRPDAFLPFLKDNLELIREDIAPTAYFMDVFASIDPFSFYDGAGARNRRRETIARWAEAFVWTREHLRGAPQVSESGHDALIGALDGATCNHLRVDPERRAEMAWPIGCADAERIPWFDLVWRDKFVLHGAGYGNRFAGGLPLGAHGPQSDDYLSVEALAGRPGMAEAPFGRGVVRKYWLWHDFAHLIGLCPVERAEFVEGDIHLQRVTYRNGAVVCVNRSPRDRAIDGVVLPPYGFFAAAEKHQAAVARRGTATVEWSFGPKAWYVNPRNQSDRGRKALRPVLRQAAARDDGTLALAIAWEGTARLDARELFAFVHFLPEDADDIVFQGDHAVPPELGGAEEAVSHGTAKVPREALPPRGEVVFRVAAGLCARATGRRIPIEGLDLGEDRVLLGTVTLRFEETLEVAAVNPVKLEPRGPAAGAEIDFGLLRSTGAFRLVREERAWVLTPLPDSDAFTAEFPFAFFPDLRGLASARAFAFTGERIDGVVAKALSDGLRITVPAGVFRCELTP